MKLIIEASHLNRILSTVKGCVPNKATMPILQHILLTGEGSTLSVRATNLEREAEASAPAQFDGDFSIALRGDILCDIGRKLPSGAQASFTSKDSGRVEVKFGSSKFTLRGLDGKDLPSMTSGKEPVSFMVPAKDLAALFSSTSYACEKDIIARPALYGVYLHVDGPNKLAAVASDEKRLGLRTVDLPDGGSQMPGVVIPPDAVRELSRLLADMDDKVLLSVSESMVEISTPIMRFSSKVMGYKFPDYKRVVPKINGATMTIHALALREAVERADIVYGSDTKWPEARFNIGENGATLSMGDADKEQVVEDLDVEVHSPSAPFRVHSKHLAEMLKLWPEDAQIDIQVGEPSKPILFTSKAYSSIQHVMMPVKALKGEQKAVEKKDAA